MSKETPQAAPKADAAEGDDEGGFLSRWSRRKREVKAEDTAAKAVPADAAPPVDEPGVAVRDAADGTSEPATAEAARQELDQLTLDELIASLPKVEEITATTDITGFLDGRIPDMLRNAALRATWMSDPAIRDFLNDARDYALDYNTPGAAPGYGPLSESERADAAEFVRTLFSDAPSNDALANDALANDAPREAGDDTLVEKKPSTQSEIRDPLLQPEIAALHNGDPAPASPDPQISGSEASAPANRIDSRPNQTILADAASQHEGAQPEAHRHDVTASPSDQTTFRRRGGSALPI
jgi:Protein of unknown function (DUF3306)